MATRLRIDLGAKLSAYWLDTTGGGELMSAGSKLEAGTLRVVAWNVRGGGGNPTAIVHQFRALAPDVVVVGEHRASGKLAGLLKEAGWIHQVGDPDPLGGYAGLLVASTFPLIKDPLHLPGEDAHRFELVTVEGTGWSVAGAYIPGYERGSDRKEHFWRFLVDEFDAACRDRHVLLIGDLNTGMHWRDELGRTFRNADDLVHLESVGWRNAFNQLHPGDRPPGTWWSPGYHNPFRLDHALLSPAAPRPRAIDHPVNAEDGILLAGKGGLSDHTPLVIDLRVTSKKLTSAAMADRT